MKYFESGTAHPVLTVRPAAILPAGIPRNFQKKYRRHTAALL